ncbi:Uncharacterised protein [Klebsiella pneumoniae]|uniref:Uncharacterized protein n=1 Tax=Klebsiella pneumoniae TaxID=573 RepID=A0A447S0X1_KLEPN|nr:Uncharacterised protein [Klebsiella pneumoniae]
MLTCGRTPSLIRKQGHQKTDGQQDRRNKKDHPQPDVVRQETAQQRTPITPLICAVDSVLSAQPLRSRGTWEATSAMALGI